MRNPAKIISLTLKKQIVRFILAFFMAWMVSVLINDIPLISDFIQKSWINFKLQQLIVFLTQTNLNFFGFDTYSSGNFLKIIGTPGVIIVYGCIGLRHLTLFTAFILFQYGKAIHKLWYILAGILTIVLVNIIRVTIICIGQYFNEDSGEMVHDIATPFLMYLTILALWIIWVNKFGLPSSGNKS